MPIRNERAYFPACLQAVLDQDYPPDKMEIFVVNGLSTDGTRELIESFAAQDHRVRLIDSPTGVVPTSMNLGITAAKGDVIVRIDGHTIVAADYLRQCVSLLSRSGADNVGGRMDARGGNIVGRAIALATSSRFGVGFSKFHYSRKEEWVDTVYLGAWPKRVFDRVGLFDEEMVRNQDDEFNFRLRANGGRILISPSVKSVYHSRSSLRALWHQYFQYGYWKVRVFQKHPFQMSPRHFMSPLFVLVWSVLIALAPFSSPALDVFLVLAGLYLSLTLIASFVVAYKSSWVLFPFLLVCFPLLHFTWGIGFLAGCFGFRHTWRESFLRKRAH
jgi:glycosyltransferase involved in cell wall biosynthesis